ncbi:polysaccharide deacetylase family protein [Streptomyces physcomitrii]|uniref:Polysaccharide deacetylase family protein n=1 Tax=Streptomyces physcomitrii TaxID=2724184 RepID=A0ABX1GWZ5_9ACTN|nr:polysaccharide deacetylase family protein [Streptomyces physcomitrii]NKI40616.1 polysaccharide deacetylase family protein [Streptomyces physcomitrii]
MRLVRQNAQWAGRRKLVHGLAAVLAFSMSAVAVGCVERGSGSPAGAPGAPGAPGAAAGGLRPLEAPAEAPRARALAAPAEQAGARAARLAAATRWRLLAAPLPAPPPPARKPALHTRRGFEVRGGQRGLPPVLTRVPTRDKVVFLTIDDGYDKDPALPRMMADLKIPYTAFLTDYLVKDDYAYFRRLRASGATLHNHTLSHPYLPKLGYAQQRREICGMQEVMEREYGHRPTLLRPPYGNYNRDTLLAARSCGIEAVPLWNEEIALDRWDYRELDRKLHAGDIVLTHFSGRGEWQGTMQDMVRAFLRAVTAQGFAVARLEDYL